MNSSLHSISGQPVTALAGETAPVVGASAARSVAQVLADSQVEAVLQELDDELVGLAPVKARIRDIAALLVIDKLRINLGLTA
jgi:hypothetical protein